MKQKQPQYRSAALRSLHEIARGLHDIGAIAPVKMQRFEKSCLIKPISNGKIKRVKGPGTHK